MRSSMTRPAIAKHLSRTFRSLWVPLAVFAAFGAMFAIIVGTMAMVHAIDRFGQTEWRNWLGATSTVLEPPAASSERPCNPGSACSS